MNKKIFAAMMFIFVIAAFFIPWIWLNQTYGMENIPHDDLTMWIFMMLYVLIAALIFLGIVVIGFSQKEEELVEDGSYQEITESLAAQYNEETVETPVEELTEEEAPAELQTEEAVEHPAEWDEEEFE